MGYKHFWITNPQTKTEGYCVNSDGALNKLTIKYENVWLSYNEIRKILNLKTKEEKYELCDKLFNKKFPQSKKDIKEVPKRKQSKLEKLFP
ncbi:MAG: hypothetical protein Q8O84_05625 [Nanoarchaeota archaeon]|nr:hypothetical protein [Nanoarchaeota archaeon]